MIKAEPLDDLSALEDNETTGLFASGQRTECFICLIQVVALSDELSNFDPTRDC